MRGRKRRRITGCAAAALLCLMIPLHAQILAETDDIPLVFPAKTFLEMLVPEPREPLSGEDASRLQVEIAVQHYDDSGTLCHTWVIQTDETGTIRFDEAHRISGDPIMTADGQTPVLPLGTYRVRKTIGSGDDPPGEEEKRFIVSKSGDSTVTCMMVS